MGLVGVLDELDGRRAVMKVMVPLDIGETGENRHTRKRFRTKKEGPAEEKVSR